MKPQRKPRHTPAVGIKAPQLALFLAGTPVTLKDLVKGDTVVWNGRGGTLCEVVEFERGLVQIAYDDPAGRRRAHALVHVGTLRRPPAAA
jgi:hypothetical protein